MNSLKEALKHHAVAVKSGVTPTIFTANQLIHLLSKHGFLKQAHKLFDEMPHRNVFSWNAIISTYVKSQNLSMARTLFDCATYKDTVTYNSMISGYVSHDGYETCAIDLFLEMQAMYEIVRVDEFTLTRMLNLTSKFRVADYGKQLHCFMVKSGNDLSGFAVGSLIDMYSKCGGFDEAYQVFIGSSVELDSVAKNVMLAACYREGKIGLGKNLFLSEGEFNNTVSWNTLISGYVKNGYEKESLKLFVHMVKSETPWDEHTLAIVLSACSSLKQLRLGKEIHGRVLKEDLILNRFISCGIVDLYCKCGNMRYAEAVHAATGLENSFSTISMIVGHSSQGNMLEARKLFDSLIEKNYVVWTAMFSGYVKSEHYEAVFELLSESVTTQSTLPDNLILLSVLSVCAIQATLDPGKQIHAYILRTSIEMDGKLASSIVDMYTKCGHINYAEIIFLKFSDRDSVIYNIMIAGYAHHGHEKEAIKLFDELLERGLKPDPITFLAVLSACRHSGNVELGEKYFNSMTKDYQISPEIDHYSCMVDLYGRANQFEKVVSFMKNIQVELLDAGFWGTFLNACRMSKNVVYAKLAEEKLMEIGECSGGRYAQLANVYAVEGKWDEMRRIRKQWKGKEVVVKRSVGCSWVYVDNKANVFTSGDKSHLKVDDIYATLFFLAADINDFREDP